MKRIIGLILLTLLLCGCTEPALETTTVPPETTQAPTTQMTEPTGIYVPFSDLEIQTQGAVRYYLPEIADCYGMRMLNGEVLIFSGTEDTTLTLLTGEKLYAVARQTISCHLDPRDSSFQLSEYGITYYNPDTREVVFLDKDLKEVSRLAMPSGMIGSPVLSSNRMQVYYCTEDAVRVYDLETGLDRLLKMIAYPSQSVEGILLNDTVLRCALGDTQGEEYTIFISTETGELLTQVHSDLELATRENHYYAVIRDGIQTLMISGLAGDDPIVLTPADPSSRGWFLTETNALVSASAAEGGIRLDYYELNSGKRTASIELPGDFRPEYMESHPATGEILVLGYDHMAEHMAILSWQPASSPVADETDYTGPRYTVEDPDMEGLTVCSEYAAAIGEPFGIEILVGPDAVENQPWDYTLEMEYQVPVVREQLEKLSTFLAHFPKDFFQQIPSLKTICIVRSIEGNAISGSMEAARGIQYWDGSTAYVVLTAGESLEYSFFHEIFHVIDSKVLSDSRAYYYWHNLNPQGVSYFQDYTSYLEEDLSQYLTEEDRIFIDAYSLCYPSEDRARVMEYACTPGNAHYFQSETMQNKLRTLCKGIREAFDLEKHPEAFLWEQYLAEPMVP